ncbi:MAG: rhodanese-like domain-containing protein [Magnetococcales bacterium]|nr:rhodanese-like domain-containing protein [Magnetococcales bacterium]
MFLNSGVLSIQDFLANPAAPIVVDVRGGPESDPAIPGSINVYVLEIEERPDAFIKRFEAQLAKRPLLLYCSKGDSSGYLQKKFSGKGRVQSLQGGMVSYLTNISRLLHEHPYEDSKKRGDTMVKLLSVLTDRKTDPATFRKIVDRLLRCTPDPKFKKLLR